MFDTGPGVPVYGSSRCRTSISEKSRNDEHEIRGRDALSSLCSIRLNEPLFSKTEQATVSVKKREGGREVWRTHSGTEMTLDKVECRFFPLQPRRAVIFMCRYLSALPKSPYDMM